MNPDFCWCQHKIKIPQKVVFLPIALSRKGLVSRNLHWSTLVSGLKEILSYFRANYFVEIVKKSQKFYKNHGNPHNTPFLLQMFFSARIVVNWNTGLVSSRVSLSSWGKGASLALASYASCNGVTVKVPYGVDVLLHWPVSQPIFSY